MSKGSPKGYQVAKIPRFIVNRKTRRHVEEKKKILLVDDEEVFLEQLKDALEQSSLNLQIDTASDGIEALKKIEADRHDIVITDVKMPKMDGYSLLKEIQHRYPSTYVVIITAFGSISGAVEAMKYGAYDFLEAFQHGHARDLARQD